MYRTKLVLGMGDGLVVVLTLGTFATNWEMLVAAKRAKEYVLSCKSSKEE